MIGTTLDAIERRLELHAVAQSTLAVGVQLLAVRFASERFPFVEAAPDWITTAQIVALGYACLLGIMGVCALAATAARCAREARARHARALPAWRRATLGIAAATLGVAGVLLVFGILSPAAIELLTAIAPGTSAPREALLFIAAVVLLEFLTRSTWHVVSQCVR